MGNGKYFIFGLFLGLWIILLLANIKLYRLQYYNYNSAQLSYVIEGICERAEREASIIRKIQQEKIEAGD